MIFATHPSPLVPLAATEVAGDAVYELARWESLGDSSWAGPLLLIVVAGLLAYVWLFYRREARSVAMGKAIVLALLRTAALAGLVAFFLGLEKRSSSRVVEPSRVAVLVDTSLSMDLPATEPTAGDPTTRATSAQVMLAATPLVDELTKQHDVDLVAFGEATQPIAYLPQLPSSDDADPVKPIDLANGDDPLGSQELAVAFAPTGHETRLGDAIAATLERYRGLPLAALVVLSDGGQNRGLELASAADAASQAKVKLHTIGFGPSDAPSNVTLRELLAPERAYPGDKLTLQAIVHVQDLAGQSVELQLSRRPAPDANEPDDPAAWELLESQTLLATTDDALETIRFETQPAEPGDYVYEVRALPVSRESLDSDNTQRARVSVIDRQTRVLLYAGGPTRDYRFLRNQLRRDQSFLVDVYLTTGGPGISQDANEILTKFPTSAEQLSKYDALVAFDPDWSTLSVEQVRWLEQWVAQQAGGLVVLPGHVNTPRWGISSQMRTIRGLYPVRMPNQLLDLRNDEQGRDVARPLAFTREGLDAEFLWLADSREASQETWQQFSGVYSSLEHNGPKPGATIYATLSGEEDNQLAYLVGHYYGAGQVFYVGSGELWRLRRLDIEHCDRLWTSLLRHTSQARLLQGSPRGKLLVSQDRYELGATVPVRVVMSDQQMQPLVVDSLTVEIEVPNGQSERAVLPADPARAGNFAGEFRVVLAGDYTLRLPVPDSTDELSRTIRVTAPQLEIGQTTRDADALRLLSQTTGGRYYATPGLAVEGSDSIPSLVDATPSQSRSKRVVGAIDKQFARSQSFTLLAIVAGALCLEMDSPSPELPGLATACPPLRQSPTTIALWPRCCARCGGKSAATYCSKPCCWHWWLWAWFSGAVCCWTGLSNHRPPCAWR